MPNGIQYAFDRDGPVTPGPLEIEMDCEARSKELESKVRYLEKRLNKLFKNTRDPLRRELAKRHYKRRKLAQCEAWSWLKGECPGDIPLDISNELDEYCEGVPVPAEPRETDVWDKKRYRNEYDNTFDEENDIKEDKLNRLVECAEKGETEVTGEGSVTHRGIGVSGSRTRTHKHDDVCGRKLDRNVFRRLRNVRERREEYKRKAEDPPSDEYSTVVEVEIDPVDLGTSELEQLSGEALNADQWGNANSEAHLTSYERFQGAEAAGDPVAMAEQAAAMVRFAVLAKENRREAARKWYLYDCSMHESLKQMRSADADADTHLEDVLTSWQSAIRAGEMPAALEQLFAESDATESEVQDFLEFVGTVTPERLEDRFAEREVELQIMGLTDDLLSIDEETLDLIEPPDIGTLASLEFASRRLYDRVLNTGVKLTLSDELPEPDSYYGGWGIVPAGSDPSEHTNWTRGWNDQPLLAPSGEFDVYWVQDYDHRNRPLLVASDIEVSNGQLTEVTMNSGVKLTLSEQLPEPDPSYGWWGIIPHGGDPDEWITRSQDESYRTLPAPPGEYDVYWVQGYYERKRPLLVASSVEVTDGQLAEVAVDSGVRLTLSEELPEPNPSYGWWSIVPHGGDPDEWINWSKGRVDRPVVAPPGEYDVYLVQGYYQRNRPVLLVSGAEVTDGQVTEIPFGSGIILQVPEDTTNLDSNYGWWSIVPHGGDPDEWITWSKGRTDQVLIVPPGKYDLFWKQNYGHDPERVQEGVVVIDGTILEVEVSPLDS